MKKFYNSSLILLLAIAFTLINQPALCQWNFDVNQNTPVDTGKFKTSTNPAIASDGGGGYYITWMRSHPGTYGTEIYAQRISATGVRLWPSPVVICNSVNMQLWPKIVTDGSGGAIITWQDNRTSFGNEDVYAQRLKPDGSVAWTANGIPVLNSSTSELGPQMISDGNGGAIIVAWSSTLGGLQTDIYAQRINSQGDRVWNVNGVVISNAANRQDIPVMVSDGNGGAIIAWQDFRNSSVPDIYAQRINASGSTLWANNGIPICNMAYDQVSKMISTDNNGGAYIIWEDFRNSTSTNEVDIYAQHVNANGNSIWSANGIPVCTVTGLQTVPNLVTDKLNDVIIAWSDFRNSASAIYAQKFTPSGTAQWANNGIPIATYNSAYSVSSPVMLSDTSNGVYIFWSQGTGTTVDLYKQHVQSTGITSFTNNGSPVCTAPYEQIIGTTQNQLQNGDVIADGKGNAVLVWQDNRNTSDQSDIYISLSSVVSPPKPIIENVNSKCQHAATAKGKIANLPSAFLVQVYLDGVLISHSNADSSFTYFTNGITNPGNHMVTVKYSGSTGSIQTDTIYTVNATAIPQITLNGGLIVNQGQASLLTATLVNGGTSATIIWQDSTNTHNWQQIINATSNNLSYTPQKTGDKVRSMLTSNAVCALPATVTSNAVSFTVQDTSSTPTSTTPVIRLYPNPANKFIVVDGLSLGMQWQYAWLYSADGKLLTSAHITGQSSVTIDVSHLANATYVLALQNMNGSKIFLRFVKLRR